MVPQELQKPTMWSHVLQNEDSISGQSGQFMDDPSCLADKTKSSILIGLSGDQAINNLENLSENP
jgi:hypothetical protein